MGAYLRFHACAPCMHRIGNGGRGGEGAKQSASGKTNSLLCPIEVMTVERNWMKEDPQDFQWQGGGG